MTTLSTTHPTLSLHLTDPALTPILSSSSQSQPSSSNTHSSNIRYRALTDLTTASATAYTSSARLGLGLPQRIMIEMSKNGPVVLHSFLNPQTERRQMEDGKQGDSSRNGSGAVESGSGIAGHVLDQTREALRPLSGSTVENEEFDAHNSGPVSKDKVARDDNDLGSSGGSGPETLANGQLVVNGMDMGKRKDVQAFDSDMLTEQPPLNSVTVAETINHGEEVEEGQSAPLLIATVVAPVSDSEARRAVLGLERLGRDFQHKFREQQNAEKQVGREIEEDGTADG